MRAATVKIPHHLVIKVLAALVVVGSGMKPPWNSRRNHWAGPLKYWRVHDWDFYSVVAVVDGRKKSAPALGQSPTCSAATRYCFEYWRGNGWCQTKDTQRVVSVILVAWGWWSGQGGCKKNFKKIISYRISDLLYGLLCILLTTFSNFT